jgi:hypothetical protein
MRINAVSAIGALWIAAIMVEGCSSNPPDTGSNSGSGSGSGAGSSAGTASGSSSGAAASGTSSGSTFTGSSSGSSTGSSSGGSSGNPNGGGGNSIAGDPDGSHAWTSIAQATWIGSPDSTGTTVIYLLSKSSPCSASAWAAGGGWDTNVPAGTIMMEFKLAAPPPATFPTMYTVPNTNPTLAAPPASGKAFAIWNQNTGTPPVAETSATGNTLTITAVNANMNIQGTFDLTFSGGHTLSGSFDAKYCQGAGEP